MKLNHINLTSIDVVADRSMFERYFGMRCIRTIGAKLAIMEDDDGVAFVINDFRRKRGDFVYPEHSDVLHIGFIRLTRQEVDDIHAQLVRDGWDVPAPRDYHGAWTFYLKAKGGYFIEVATPTRTHALAA